MPHRTTLLLAASLLLISPCAAQTSPAATPAPPAPPRAPQAAGSASLSSLVAEAIKRKLERINSTKNPSIEPPPTDTGPSPADSAAAPPRTLPSIDPAPLAPAAPNPAM
ncbi:MAG: hypothetical protein K2Q09_05280, partial [Phycisphaerales bacterium]|nr:hypothetical protein [Phycisphaerales bacterium]